MILIYGWFVLWLVTIKKVPMEKMNGTNTYRTKSLKKNCTVALCGGKTACMQQWQSYKVLCLINHRCSQHLHLPDNSQTQSSNLTVKKWKEIGITLNFEMFSLNKQCHMASHYPKYSRDFRFLLDFFFTYLRTTSLKPSAGLFLLNKSFGIMKRWSLWFFC